MQNDTKWLKEKTRKNHDKATGEVHGCHLPWPSLKRYHERCLLQFLPGLQQPVTWQRHAKHGGTFQNHPKPNIAHWKAFGSIVSTFNMVEHVSACLNISGIHSATGSRKQLNYIGNSMELWEQRHLVHLLGRPIQLTSQGIPKLFRVRVHLCQTVVGNGWKIM